MCINKTAISEEIDICGFTSMLILLQIYTQISRRPDITRFEI